MLSRSWCVGFMWWTSDQRPIHYLSPTVGIADGPNMIWPLKFSLSSLVLAIAAALLTRTSVGSEPEPIKVGILHSLTGTMAFSERPLVDAALLAINEINGRGGILGREILPVIEDGASDWPTFARKAEKLIVEDRVCTVFGCWTSASRKAVLPVFQRHDHLLWYPLQYEGQERSPNVIYLGATLNQQIIPAVRWCLRHFGSNFYLVGSDYIFPRTANKGIKAHLAAKGGRCVGERYRPLGDIDFQAIAAAIGSAQPDVIFNTINGDSNIAFFEALRAAAIDPSDIPVMSVSIAEPELTQMGPELLQGHFCAWNYFQSLDTPANHRFVRAFKAKYGADRVTSDPIEAAYSQVYLFSLAVQKAKSTDPRKVRSAARGLTFHAPQGLIRIDPENQHTWKVARIGRIQENGQFDVVWSSEDPIRPEPYARRTMLSELTRLGDTLFMHISTMIDLEREAALTGEHRDLLLAMTDVRGYLGQMQTRLREAVLRVDPSHLAEFRSSWVAFGQRYEVLLGLQDLLTPEQATAFSDFRAARTALEARATRVAAVLYPARGEPKTSLGEHPPALGGRSPTDEE